MKKNSIISAAFVAVLFLGACARVETVVPDTLKEDVPIDFSWYTSRVQTKANPTYFVGDATTTGVARHLNSGTSMGVFGYFHPQNAGVAGTWDTSAGSYNTPNLFYNEAVSITETAGNYTYDYVHDRFWPRNQLDRISFIAYYPWNELNTTGSATDETIVEPFLDTRSERQGMVGFYYVVPAKSEDQVDFMVSDLCLEQSKAVWTATNHAQGLTGNANGKVKFFFHHALSQIRVKSVSFDTGGNNDVELKINYIVFKNVAVFGQCIPVPDFSHTDANTGRTPVTPSWPTGTLVARRPDLTSGVTADVCYNGGTWDVNKFLLMIPHTFFTGAAIEVNFDVTRWKNINDPNNYLQDGTPNPDKYYYRYGGNTLSAPLTTTSVYEWQAGKIYTYNITLDLKQIKVTADVVDWLPAGEDILMDN